MRAGRVVGSVVLAMPVMVMLGMTLMSVAVPVAMVVVAMAAAGQLEDGEAHPGGDQDHADDRVLRALKRRAELQPDGDDHAAEDDREQDVRDPSQPERRATCERG